MVKDYILPERTSENLLWRPKYHFTPPSGWMNDPNGLIYFKGWYHLFYQYNPYHCNWDSMHWGHAVSKDMVHWKDLPMALTPDQSYDNHPEGGCFSGSAVEKDGRLYLFYTGSIKKEGTTVQTQCMAFSDDGVHFTKYENNPVIAAPPKGASGEFRDPKVFSHNQHWYMVVGGTVGDSEGDGNCRVFFYESENLVDWTYKGVLLESNGKYGSMIECPDFFPLGDKWVLTCSPMNHPQNIKALYCIGTMDFENGSFQVEEVGNIDEGFDYYAPQSFVDKNGKRVMIAWQNEWLWMPWCENWGPTSSENWRGALSVPRVATIENHQLHLYPVEELRNAFETTKKVEKLKVSTDRLYLDTDHANSYLVKMVLKREEIKSKVVELTVLGHESEGTVISLDLVGNVLTLEKRYASERGSVHCNMGTLGNEIEVLVMVDNSCVEAYVDRGAHCITNNVYPSEKQKECWISTPYKTAQVECLEVCCLVEDEKKES